MATTNDSVLLTSGSRLPPVNLLRPSTMEEALAILSENPNARPISGGTHLVPGLLSRRVSADTLVDLSAISGYRYVKLDGGYVKIGGLTTLAELAESEYLDEFDAIETFKNSFVSPPVMNLATVGGSMALGALTEDLITIFYSLDAYLRIMRKNGEELVPLATHLTTPPPPLGPGIIIGVDVPSPRNYLFCFFGKLNMSVSRIPFASLALASKFDGEVFSEVTLVGNCVNTGHPGRLIETENALKNTRFDEESIDRAVVKLKEEASPHSDYLAPARYRKEALVALFRKISVQTKEQVIPEK